MNHLIQFKTIVVSLVITVVLACFGLSPKARAVLPAPDGGYLGFNTAEGQNALFSLTTGVANTAVGWFSLKSDTDGSFNTAVGAGTLLFNIGNQGASQGIENTAIGAASLLLNTTGAQNTAVGVAALLSNDGDSNTAIGFRALANNTTAESNTATGAFALENNTVGFGNTATGFGALLSNTDGDDNTAIGDNALVLNSTGNGNTAVGSFGLETNASGSNNAAFGANALFHNTDGSANTAVGDHALFNATTGQLNTVLGQNAGSGVTTASHVICIGAEIAGANVDNSCFVGQIYQRQVGNDNLPVQIDSFGKLGTTVSSKRFKHDVSSMNELSEIILALRPVTFHYKSDPTNTPQFGLIAEEVAELNPALVVRDNAGHPYSVRYDQVNAMLLNEFLKEHRTVQDLKSAAAKQEAKIARQQKQIDALTAGLQKVSAQLEVIKPGPQTVCLPAARPRTPSE
jgi:Chaperone of endosialidase